jgi:hypothetical protein
MAVQTNNPNPSAQPIVGNGYPVDYQIEISNSLDHPVTLTLLEVETVGDSGAYSLRRVKHAFKRDIAARGSDAFQIRAWVRPLHVNEMGESTGPVTLRGIARFDSPKGIMKSAFAMRVQ